MSSLDGGATWTTGRAVSGPMRVTWIANTNQGRMVGDYTSTSFTGDGKAHPVFSWAKPLDTGANGSHPNTPVSAAPDDGVLRHHGSAARPPEKEVAETVARSTRALKQTRPARLVTAN